MEFLFKEGLIVQLITELRTFWLPSNFGCVKNLRDYSYDSKNAKNLSIRLHDLTSMYIENLPLYTTLYSN